jgi:WD40 repeat protein
MSLNCFEGHDSIVADLAVSPDTTFLATGSADYTVKLWSIKAKNEKTNFPGHEHGTVAVTISPDSKMVISGGHDGLVRIWSVSDKGPPPRQLKGHKGVVTCITCLNDGLIATGGSDGIVIVWDIGENKEIWRFDNESEVQSLAASHDGRSVFSGDLRGVVRMWPITISGRK